MRSLINNRSRHPAVKSYHFSNAQITVEYSDFLPTQFLSDKINQELTDLSFFCPDQSKVNASFNWTNDACRVDLRVIHNLRTFHADASKVNPTEALASAIRNIKSEIRIWRKDRYGDGATYLSDLKIGKKSLTATDVSHLKVLLVDDDPISVKLIETCFRQQGCETMITTSGMDAVRSLEKMDCDLLVLDWLMPDISGRDVILKTAQNLDGRDHVKIPVLTYSVYGNQDIEFPQTEHFTRLGHIKKSMPYKHVKNKTIETLDRIKKDKQDVLKNLT